MTKEYIKEAYDKLRKRLGRQPGRDEFFRHTNVNSHSILTTFRNFNVLVEEMGDTPRPFAKEKRSDEDFMTPYGNLVRQLKRIPTHGDWVFNKCKPNESSYKRRFGLSKFSDIAYEFQKFAKDKTEWSDILHLLPTSNDAIKKLPVKETEECYVYFMFDSQTLCYKIGISNLPEWREKTLQNEKPSIKLIAAKKFVNRRIAANIEKALHESYSHKRKRGEWFQLDDEDVEEIKATLDN